MTRIHTALLCSMVVSLSALPMAWAETTVQYNYEWFGVEDPSQELFLCSLLPYENCRGTIDSRMSYGGSRAWNVGQQTSEPIDAMLFSIDGGYLFRVLERPSLQVGPIIGLELKIFDESLGYHLYSAALVRLWAGRWIAIDTSFGIVGSFDGNFRARGVGGLGELAVTAHGHVGLYIQTQVIYGPDGVETHLTGGFRGSLVAFLCIFAGMAG